MLFAANTPVPDSMWLPAAVVLIFAAPIGAFLAIYAAVTGFLFRSFRESIPVMVLDFLAVGVNGCALLLLVDSTYNGVRYLIVPLMAFIVAVVASCVTACRAFRLTRTQHRPQFGHTDDFTSRCTEDR